MLACHGNRRFAIATQGGSKQLNRLLAATPAVHISARHYVREREHGCLWKSRMHLLTLILLARRFP